MKVFISVDMEGIPGISTFEEEEKETQRFRDCLHQQLEWVIEGIHTSSKNDTITEITIADSHGLGNNLSYHRLCAMDPRISLVSGYPRPNYMMAGLDSTYDIIFFVGYHAGQGQLHSNMDHSYSARIVSRLCLNGNVMNESTINAAYGAALGVPVALVIGDSGLRHELIDKEQMPWVHFVTTKESLSRFAAKHRPASLVRKETIFATEQALNASPKSYPLYPVKEDATLLLDVKSTAMADIISSIPGVVRKEGRQVQLHLDDSKTILEAISAMTELAKTTY